MRSWDWDKFIESIWKKLQSPTPKRSNIEDLNWEKKLNLWHQYINQHKENTKKYYEAQFSK